MEVNKTDKIFCSFCGKEITDDEIICGGNNSVICSDCAKLAYDNYKEVGVYNPSTNIETSMNDVPKPIDIKKYLDEYVIGQDIAKERLAVAIYNHYKRLNYNMDTQVVDIQKANIILAGATGSGKSYLVQTIAKMLDVPVAMVDATVLTQAGYVGEDIESCISRLLQAANYDVEKAERGIVFIDEIDKIGRKGSNPSITRDVSGEGVQQGLLKLLEGSIVNVAPQGGRKHPDQKYIQVNTKNVLFICAGAFEGIEDKIGRRHNVHAVGYNADQKRTTIDKNKMIEKITAQDLKSFGLIPEIIGRLPVITYVEELDEAALKKILTEPKNALVKQYQELFKMDGIELTFDKKVFDLVAKKAVESKTGARGLRSIMEDLMNKLMFELPSSDKKEFKVTLAYAKKQLEEK